MVATVYQRHCLFTVCLVCLKEVISSHPIVIFGSCCWPIDFPPYNSVSFLHTVTLPPVPVEVEGSKRSALQMYYESGLFRETPAMSLLQMSDLALLWFSRMCFVGVHPVSVAEGSYVCWTFLFLHSNLPIILSGWYECLPTYCPTSKGSLGNRDSSSC